VGAFTNLSSADPIPRNPTREMLPHLHLYGGSLALGYFIKHSLLRLGVVAAYGKGHDVVAADTGGRPGYGESGYLRLGLKRLLVHVYLASTFRY
jgi:hypothetical protein